MSEGAAVPAIDPKSEATAEEVNSVLHPELDPQFVTVGDREISIKPLVRRWQALFTKAALPLFLAEMAGTEIIAKAVHDGIADFTNVTTVLIQSELEADTKLDRAAAVVLASQDEKNNKDTEKAILKEIEWIQDHTNTEELRTLVETQAAKERLVESVGERLPARFVRSSRLAGKTDVTADLVRQGLTNYLRRSEALRGSGV